MKIILYPTNSVSVWLIWGRRMLFAKRFDLDLGMIKLWAKIGTLCMGQKGDSTLYLPSLWYYHRSVSPGYNRCLSVSQPTMILLVSWEPEGHYCCSTIFCWEPEGNNHHRLYTETAPFWFSKKIVTCSINTKSFISHRKVKLLRSSLN